MRRVLSAGIVVFVAVAFTVAALTGGKGWLFLVSLVSAAGMLIVVVFLVAFGGSREPRRETPGGDFLDFEEAARHATRGGLSDESDGSDRWESPGNRSAIEASKLSAQTFVRTLVPLARPPLTLSEAASRREFLDALRKEGAGLIRLANVAGVDITPYQAFLVDARRAALRGERDATLRSLQLGNELLRSTIEKFLIKRKRAGQGSLNLDEL